MADRDEQTVTNYLQSAHIAEYACTGGWHRVPVAARRVSVLWEFQASSSLRAVGMSVYGRFGNARQAGAGSKVMSMVSMASAARAWRASAGLMAAVSVAIACRAGRGMCRTVPRRPAACCRMAATWLKVRLSG